MLLLAPAHPWGNTDSNNLLLQVMVTSIHNVKYYTILLEQLSESIDHLSGIGKQFQIYMATYSQRTKVLCSLHVANR